MHANGQNLNGEDADVRVLCDKITEEWDIGPQTNADAVDE
jgi:hypothetical protein